MKSQFSESLRPWWRRRGGFSGREEKEWALSHTLRFPLAAPCSIFLPMSEFWQQVLALPPALLGGMVFLYGTFFGSFLNVCIHRLPAGQSVIFPGSRCACGQPIAWFDNIPILSWLILRGRARCCGRPFSFRYPLVEALTGALFLLCWVTNPPALALCGMVLVFFLVGASFIDLDHMIIPDSLAVGGMMAGLFLCVWFPALHGHEGPLFMIEAFRSFVDGLIGALIGSAVIVWIRIFGEIVFRREAMGMGDVTLMGMIGAFCGWQGAIFAVFGGAMVGCVLVGVSLLFRKKEVVAETGAPTGADAESESVAGSAEAGKPTAAETEEILPVPGPGEVPFGPSLAIAGLLYFTVCRDLVDNYFREIIEVIYYFP